jgi:hypothetical protein
VAGRVARRGRWAGLTLKIVLLILAAPDQDLTRGEKPHRSGAGYTCGNVNCRYSISKAEFDANTRSNRKSYCTDCGAQITQGK